MEEQENKQNAENLNTAEKTGVSQEESQPQHRYVTQESEKEEKRTLFWKLKRFYVECIRVLRVTKKPDKEEFNAIVKVTAIGMAIIGAIGFVIVMIGKLFF